MNIYQRIVLILGAFVLVVSLWTAPQYIKKATRESAGRERGKIYLIDVKYKSEIYKNNRRIFRGIDDILVRSIGILGVTVLVFIALKEIQKIKND